MAYKIFITATDTDAGKTWITASALRQLRRQHEVVRGVKPIACGVDRAGENMDVRLLLEAQALDDSRQINRYTFRQPAAPLMAAQSEQREVVREELLHWCEMAGQGGELLLIEGVGGLMVPLAERYLVSDWLRDLHDAEVWLVVACRLGAINQALLSLYLLQEMGRNPARIFFNAASKELDCWIEPTVEAVQPYLHQGCTIHRIRYGEQVGYLDIQ